MDGFRDRFGSRYDRNNTTRNSQGRTNNAERMSNDRTPERGMDRNDRYEGDYDYAGRDEYLDRSYIDPRGRRNPQSDFGSSRQLDLIQDYLEEANEDRRATGKEIIHAVDGNSKKIDKSLEVLDELKESVNKVVSQESEAETIDIEELSHKNKEEILEAILNNTNLIGALKEELEKRAEEEKALLNEKKESEEEADDKPSLEDLISGLEDHVHKESVKCYRNVMGALEDKDKDSEDKVAKNVGTVKIFSIIQLALTTVNLILLILYIFRIL
ncbi:MAG: hypothetical protein K6B28_01090 [Lachnospiraceae bacterium]|nr:hypothetical protein [Lachnospiraceae bacterium]